MRFCSVCVLRWTGYGRSGHDSASADRRAAHYHHCAAAVGRCVCALYIWICLQTRMYHGYSSNLLEDTLLFHMFHLFCVSSSTAAVIALFCRQYDIIKDNDSNSAKDKTKRPLVRATSSYYNASAHSSPIYHNGAVRSSRVTHLHSNPSNSFKSSVVDFFIVKKTTSSYSSSSSWLSFCCNTSLLCMIISQLPGIFCFLWRALCSCIRDLLATRAAAIIAKYKTTRAGNTKLSLQTLVGLPLEMQSVIVLKAAVWQGGFVSKYKPMWR